MAKNTYGYVNSDYLKAAAELFAPIKCRSFELLDNIVGRKVLDLGCGPGLDTLALAVRVGEQGQVTGVDCDAEMIALARCRAQRSDVAAQVLHLRADACELPFADKAFNASRSERLFMHLAHPGAALAEAVRVTRPGGKVVIVDSDWGSLSTATELTEIERNLARFRAESFLPNGYSGRRLFGLMRECGLEQIGLETFALHLTDLPLWRYLTQAEAVEAAALNHGFSQVEMHQWHSALQDSYQKGNFFSSISVVIAAANKPY